MRHIGPTAQDFCAAFHLGSINMSIGTADADGVSLAAITALAKRTQELQPENSELESRLDTPGPPQAPPLPRTEVHLHPQHLARRRATLPRRREAHARQH